MSLMFARRRMDEAAAKKKAEAKAKKPAAPVKEVETKNHGSKHRGTK